MSRCQACDAEIVWAITKNGKRMPVDPEPTEGGNVELVPGRKLEAIVHAQPPLGAEKLHMPHHATCPNVEMFRKR